MSRPTDHDMSASIGAIYAHAEKLGALYRAGERKLYYSNQGMCREFDMAIRLARRVSIYGGHDILICGYLLGRAMLGEHLYSRGLGLNGEFNERRYQFVTDILNMNRNDMWLMLMREWERLEAQGHTELGL
jgi:hypothetical protein